MFESHNRFLLVTVWEFVPNAAMRLGVAIITVWQLKWKSYKRSNLIRSKFFIAQFKAISELWLLARIQSASWETKHIAMRKDASFFSIEYCVGVWGAWL